MKRNHFSENDIKVYSVESDAFSILTRVMGEPNHCIKSYQTGILNFEEGIGKWRLNQFPTNKYIF